MKTRRILGNALEVALFSLILLPVHMTLEKDENALPYLLYWMISAGYTVFVTEKLWKKELMLLLCFGVTRRQCTWSLLKFRLACAAVTAAVSMILWLAAGRFLEGSALDILPIGLGIHMMISTISATEMFSGETNRWVLALWIAMVAVWFASLVVSQETAPWTALCIGTACQVLGFFGDNCKLKAAAVSL